MMGAAIFGEGEVFLVRISLPSRVACRRYSTPLWLMSTAFCPRRMSMLSTAPTGRCRAEAAASPEWPRPGDGVSGGFKSEGARDMAQAMDKRDGFGDQIVMITILI